MTEKTSSRIFTLLMLAGLAVLFYNLGQQVSYNTAYRAGLDKGLSVGVENCDPYLPNE